jgi:hypothetical protein
MNLDPANPDGPPDLALGRLRLWVHGIDDDQWLDVTARCESDVSCVSFRGPFAALWDLQKFLPECERLDRELKGTAVFQSTQPGLEMRLEADRLGFIHVVIRLAPEGRAEVHEYEEGMEPVELQPLIRAIRAIVARWS